MQRMGKTLDPAGFFGKAVLRATPPGRNFLQHFSQLSRGLVAILPPHSAGLQTEMEGCSTNQYREGMPNTEKAVSFDSALRSHDEGPSNANGLSQASLLAQSDQPTALYVGQRF